MRKLLVALGLVAVGIGASACSSTPSATSTTIASVPSTAASTTTLQAALGTGANNAAARAMRTALQNGRSRPSLHYVSTSVGNELTTTIVGDVNQTSGSQTIVVSYEGAKARIDIELVGDEAYFRGDAAAIEVLINLTAPQSAAAAGQWVSVVPADSVYQSTAAALTVGSVVSELALSPPITGERAATYDDRSDIEISGAWIGEGVTAKDHATGELQVTKGSGSLPIAFDGVMPAAAGASRFTASLVVSRWGEPVHVVPPPSSVPLATIVKDTTTTTTQLVVV
ncbi:MAG: hypothetical protein ABSF89_13725 [Acidimicrobiales bacterium]